MHVVRTMDNETALEALARIGERPENVVDAPWSDAGVLDVAVEDRG